MFFITLLLIFSGVTINLPTEAEEAVAKKEKKSKQQHKAK